MGSNKEWLTGSYTYDPDAPNEWTNDDGTYAMTHSEIYTATNTETATVGPFDSLSDGPNMFDTYDQKQLRNKYPALQQAWDHYQTVLKMCQAKEDEDA